MLTLVEAAKIHTGDVVRSGIIEMFARAADILRVLPFIDVPGGAYHYLQEGVLPGVAFRGVNQAFAESTGVVNPQVEVLRIAGGDLDVDRAIIAFHGEDVRGRHESMKIKALALYMQKKIIKGDSLTDVREFDGLQNRLTGSQLIAAKDAGPAAGGDPLSLLKLDELIDSVDDPTHLIMSKAMRRIITAAARTTSVSGFVTWEKDEFGRKVAVYNDLPILIADMDDLGARVLAFDEVGNTGTTFTSTSIYCVSFGESMLTGIQNGVMSVRDLGEVDDRPVMRTRLDWYVSLAALHGRCAARLNGISNAPAIA